MNGEREFKEGRTLHILNSRENSMIIVNSHQFTLIYLITEVDTVHEIGIVEDFY